jgi:hypothetical protein
MTRARLGDGIYGDRPDRIRYSSLHLNQPRNNMRRILWLLVLFPVCVSTVTAAQWLNYRTPGVPRTRDGRPKLDAPAPRAPDGRPDLTGVWMHELTSVDEMKRLFGPMIDEAIRVDVPGMEIGTQHKYGFDILVDFKPENSPMRPETAEFLQRKLSAPRLEDLCDAGGAAGLAGFPLAGLLSEPIKIVQAPRLTMVLYEVGSSYRQIYSDGRALPREVNLPAYYGYSVGRWDRDTFVVETAGFNDKTSLDAVGHPHSDQLHVVERFRRRDFGHLDLEMTFDDPKMYMRPFTVRVPHTLLADQDIFEMFPENEKDCARIGKK